MPQLSRFVPDDSQPYIDLVHVIYPEDVFVTPDVILGWAHDALVNESVQDHVNQHGPFSDDAAGEKAYELIASGVSRPTDIDEAKEILSDLGSHTFARM
jgi:hypothetical protein